MKLHSLPLRETHSFSSFFLDYISQHHTLENFYHRFPNIQNFEGQIAEKKSFSGQNRTTLCQSLQQQYEGIKVLPAVESNLSSLKDSKTFTVTTGHQLCIMTGPLYFIYKIVTVINACKKLKAHYPDYHFVPVYWMASEDHDYDEIKSFRLNGKKYSWETQQTGAVGRFDPKSLAILIDELPGDMQLFKNAYVKNKTLAQATRHLVNELFGHEGLIVVDGDDRQLKSLFKNVIADDLFRHTPKQLVEEKNNQLKNSGYHPQVFARDINFFYLNNNVRQRIEKTGDHYSVLETDLKFSSDEINRLIEASPEQFSPNVILRPLYQETILPNLAYAGGPAEVVYWLQMKGMFDHFHIPFPILMPRNFAAVMDEPTRKKFLKSGLELKDLFEEKNYLFNHWIVKNSQADLSLQKEIELLKQIFEVVKKKATQIDSTLSQHTEAQTHLLTKKLEGIEQKMLRAEKRKQADHLRQLETIKDFLFPNGSPQERTDNFLNFYQADRQFIQKLIQHLDPFDFRFNVLEL
ncbi:MAG: bacillithiol biosynthesis cysteine-adding enzyme BshC [Bacteroidetes bacterium]|nr:bacillithiol biosynthesis cysteine-adding enzyme BshC [Bacteroidota bacterium]MBS1541409.1 bacillithiol biosynthesis cysteine-adding enzyme BshC [Bacteroidota bacterium]